MEEFYSKAFKKESLNSSLPIMPKPGTVVAVETTDNMYTLDYYLTCFEKSISDLKNGLVLRPVYYTG